jgi:NhaP-type Na+/H+ or K+/H+ antiporter
VALDDAVGLVVFAVSFGVAGAIQHGTVDVVSMVVNPLLEVILSLALGAVMGFLFTLCEQFFHSRSKRMAISVTFVMLTVAISSLKFEIGGVHIGFSLLLVCMMTGTMFCNICDTSEELMERAEKWTVPINILFFVISGAELDLQVLINPLTLLVGVLYIIARSAGKYFGASISCRLTHQTKPITNNLGITLLPQAGVALGMALTAATLSDGTLTRNVVLFAVLIYELVGPALTKRSLLAVGEIQAEGRTSARRHNMPK